MSKYTTELRTVIYDHHIDIFDWAKIFKYPIDGEPYEILDFHRTPESKAILSDEDLKNGFIKHYYFREIGAETVERFKHFLMVQWTESLGEFDALLVAYKDQEKDILQNNKSEYVNIVNDTPKSRVDFSNELDTATGHASLISNGVAKSLSGLTKIEALELLHNKIKDIQTEFYNSFDNLFMQLY